MTGNFEPGRATIRLNLKDIQALQRDLLSVFPAGPSKTEEKTTLGRLTRFIDVTLEMHERNQRYIQTQED